MKQALISRREIKQLLTSNAPLVKKAVSQTDETVTIRIEQFALQKLLEDLDIERNPSITVRIGLTDSIQITVIEVETPLTFNLTIQCSGVMFPTPEQAI